ncbi:hypothetical protein D9M70_528570 [compost metagenome]
MAFGACVSGSDWGAAARQSRSGRPFSPLPGVSWAVLNTSRRAPTSELPLYSCKPNQGTWLPLKIALSQSDTSASSTAIGLRSTPKTLLSAMYIFTRCFSSVYCSWGMLWPSSFCLACR